MQCFVDVAAAAKDVDVAVMVGGYPRKAGEERKVRRAGRQGDMGDNHKGAKGFGGGVG